MKESRNIPIFQQEYKPNCKNIIFSVNLSIFEIERFCLENISSGVIVTAKISRITQRDFWANYSVIDDLSEDSTLKNLINALCLVKSQFIYDYSNNAIRFTIQAENIISLNAPLNRFLSR